MVAHAGLGDVCAVPPDRLGVLALAGPEAGMDMFADVLPAEAASRLCELG
jgi:hypothetical protein